MPPRRSRSTSPTATREDAVCEKTTLRERGDNRREERNVEAQSGVFDEWRQRSGEWRGQWRCIEKRTNGMWDSTDKDNGRARVCRRSGTTVFKQNNIFILAKKRAHTGTQPTRARAGIHTERTAGGISLARMHIKDIRRRRGAFGHRPAPSSLSARARQPPSPAIIEYPEHRTRARVYTCPARLFP